MKINFTKGIITSFLIATLSLTGITGFSQAKVSFGPKMGINFSHMEGYAEDELKNNFTGGLFFVVDGLGRFGFSTDFMYSGKGAEYEFKGDGTDADKNSVTLHYFEMPLLLNFYLNDVDAKYRPKLVAGPAFAGLTGVQTTGDYQPDFYQTFDMGAVIGTGLAIKMGPAATFHFDARYTYGLLNINVESENVPNDVSNRNLGITAGVAFNLGQ